MNKVLIACLVIFMTFVVASSLEFKSIQGPPSEFKVHVLPSPGDVFDQSNYARYKVRLNQGNGETAEWVKEFPVDATTLDHGYLRIGFLTPMKNFRVFLKVPGAEKFEELKDPIQSSLGMSTKASLPAVVFQKKTPVPQGMYTVKVVAQTQHIVTSGKGDLNMMMIVENDSPYHINAHLDTFKFVQGESVGIVTRVYDEQAYRAKLMAFKGLNHESEVHELYDTTDGPLPLPDAILLESVDSIEWDVMFPDGHEERVNLAPMNQNGIFSGKIKASQAGDYVADVLVTGTLPGGKPFERALRQMFKVVSSDEHMTLLSNSHGQFDSKTEFIEFDIQADVEKPEAVSGNNFKVYAEVWTKEGKSETPVAFVGGMTTARTTTMDKAHLIGKVSHAALEFPVKLHVNWMSMANMRPTMDIVLKNVYIQDVATSIPLTTAESIHVHVSQNHKNMMASRNAFNGEITEVMKMGPRPLKYQKAHRNTVMSSQNGYVGGHKTVLSHGYCTDEPGFPADQFTDPTVFEDFNQNRNNDEFAQLLNAECEKYESCAIVGHSQGGLAALTALAYYWTALDMNDEHGDSDRWIESVGSPYQGTSASGWGDLGVSFGVGCGSVADMTPEGAKLWLSAIPMEARSHVYFYITDYGSWSSCTLASNLVLKWTNDGATETDRARLPGGNYVLGKPKAKFCHTEDMNHPSQTNKWTQNNCFMNAKIATNKNGDWSKC